MSSDPATSDSLTDEDGQPTVRELPTERRPDYRPSFKARITANGFIQLQPAGQQPATFYQRWDRRTETDEMPYLRPQQPLKEEDGWRPLDVGWLAATAGGGGAGLIIVTNHSPNFQLVPTPEERAAAYAAVVVVAADGRPFARVRPGEASLHFEPLDGVAYTIRCQAGAARVTILAFPR